MLRRRRVPPAEINSSQLRKRVCFRGRKRERKRKRYPVRLQHRASLRSREVARRTLLRSARFLWPDRASREAVFPGATDGTLDFRLAVVLELLFAAPFRTTGFPLDGHVWDGWPGLALLLKQLAAAAALRPLRRVAHGHGLGGEGVAERAVETAVGHGVLGRGNKHLFFLYVLFSVRV